MLIKIPKTFKIGATRAVVGYEENLFIDQGFNGTYNKRTEELHIDSRLYGGERAKTFGHEVMEVIKHNYNLNTSENDMSSIANGWVEFLYQLGVEFDFSDIKEVKNVD